MEAVVLYALAVYMAFHVVGRSDLLERPRAWFVRAAGPKLSYPLTCALCWTFHCSWMLLLATVILPIQIVGVSWQAMLFVAPVVNLVLDLVIRKLRMDAEPPVLTDISERTARNKRTLDVIESWSTTHTPESGWKS